MSTQLEVRDAITDLYLNTNRYGKLCSELEKQYPQKGKVLLELTSQLLLEEKFEWNAHDSIETQIKIFVNYLVKVRDAIENLCADKQRYNEVCGRLKKRHGWVEGVLDQSWEGYLDLAIALLLENQRKWNDCRYPRIEEQIEAIVDSLVSHDYAKKRANFIEIHLEDQDAILEDLEDQEAILEDQDAIAIKPYVDSNPKVRQKMFARLQNGKKSDKLEQMLKFRLENEPRLNSQSGRYLWEPSEIAKGLGWDIQEVNRLTKMLRRRLKDLEYSLT